MAVGNKTTTTTHQNGESKSECAQYVITSKNGRAREGKIEIYHHEISTIVQYLEILFQFEAD